MSEPAVGIAPVGSVDWVGKECAVFGTSRPGGGEHLLLAVAIDIVEFDFEVPYQVFSTQQFSDILPASVINNNGSVLRDVEPVIVGILGPHQLELLRVKAGNGDNQLLFFSSRSSQVSCVEENISSVISLINIIVCFYHTIVPAAISCSFQRLIWVGNCPLFSNQRRVWLIGVIGPSLRHRAVSMSKSPSWSMSCHSTLW